MAISRNFCPFNFPPILNSSDSGLRGASKSQDFLSPVGFKLHSLSHSLLFLLFRLLRFTPTILLLSQLLEGSNLQISKPLDVDGNPPIVLKMCAPQLTPTPYYLSHLNQTTSPSPKENAIIFPIPKHGYLPNPSNFPIILLTSCICSLNVKFC